MTNTMTPSEIAEWCEKASVTDDTIRSPLVINLAQAAATIRELEARVNNQSEIIKRQAVSGVNTAERLKIATEALEAIKITYPEDSGAHVEASYALARIKGVG